MDPAAELARLDAAPGYRLTIIIDPDGETKDALLQSWTERQACPFAWLGVQQSDNDPAIFFSRLQACLRSTGHFPAAPACHGDNPAWEEYLTEALNDAIDLAGDFFLIIDGYELITTPEIHQALGWVLDYIPDPMHLIITSRQQLPLPIPRLRLRRQLLEIELG